MVGRWEGTVTHIRERESIASYIPCCVVLKFFFQKAAAEVAVENELSTVILVIQHVPCQKLFISKPLKCSEQKGGFPSRSLIVPKG